MQNRSPFSLTSQLQAQVRATLSAIDVVTLRGEERKIVGTLSREIADARLDTRDYEISETRAEQLNNAKIAQDRLATVRKLILAASEFNVFSAVDVALLTAHIEQIIEELI